MSSQLKDSRAILLKPIGGSYQSFIKVVFNAFTVLFVFYQSLCSLILKLRLLKSNCNCINYAIRKRINIMSMSIKVYEMFIKLKSFSSQRAKLAPSLEISLNGGLQFLVDVCLSVMSFSTKKLPKAQFFRAKNSCFWQFYGPIRVCTNILKKNFGRVIGVRGVNFELHLLPHFF